MDREPPEKESNDPRFLFANERTLLAWLRTALAFVATGLALVALRRVGVHDDWPLVAAAANSVVGLVTASPPAAIAARARSPAGAGSSSPGSSTVRQWP